MNNQVGFMTQRLMDSGQPLYQYNGKQSNVNIDNALAAILDQFDENYIIDAIEFSLENKFRLYDQPMPNMVYAYEQQFVRLTDGFQSNAQDIASARTNTYLDIINILCNRHDLAFNFSDDIDYYSAAFYLYEFLVSKFTDNIRAFYTNYIIQEKDSLYKGMELDSIDKGNIALGYSMKIFKSPKLAAIHANMGRVLEDIQTMDIDLYTIFDMVYAQKDISRYLYNLVSDQGNFFLNFFEKHILDPISGPELQTAIKLNLQTCAAMLEDAI